VVYLNQTSLEMHNNACDNKIFHELQSKNIYSNTLASQRVLQMKDVHDVQFRGIIEISSKYSGVTMVSVEIPSERALVPT